MVIGTVAELGMRVRERRKELGMLQRMLAERVGTTRQWISNLERGKRTTEIGMVLDTLRALGLVVDVRARGQESPSAKALRAISAQLMVGGESSDPDGTTQGKPPQNDPIS